MIQRLNGYVGVVAAVVSPDGLSGQPVGSKTSLRLMLIASPRAATVNTVYVEPVSEDRAHKCLGRIDLLIKIRRDILVHSQLEERLNELTKVKVVETTRHLFSHVARSVGLTIG